MQYLYNLRFVYYFHNNFNASQQNDTQYNDTKQMLTREVQDFNLKSE